MYPFFESIRIKDGLAHNLYAHQDRMNRTCTFHHLNKFDLNHIIHHLELPAQGNYKLRISYLKEILEIKLTPYEIKPIQTLKLVENHEIRYPFKSENRKNLKYLFKDRGDADDILISVHGQITDTSYASIIFYKNKRWFTPKSYLLKGTMVSNLVVLGQVAWADIHLENLRSYSHFKVVNAMRPPHEIEAQEISNIIF